MSAAAAGTRLEAGALARALLGGVLMGLANLVPGISGGTMLLAAGVYPQFIDGVAEVSTFRFRIPSLAMLGCIVGAAAAAILILAGTIRAAVIDHRWAMFSLFIGLTLGGVPVVWRLLRPLTPAAIGGGAVGVALMAVMAFVPPAASSAAGGETPYLLLFVAGAAGASAMILPGVSGGYLLLVLGQYLTILGAIDAFKQALLGADGGIRWEAVLAPLHVFVPVGLGVALGVVGVSNLLRLLMRRFEKATLGFLLGLLLGAVLGLWPFQVGVRPQPGDVVRGQVMTGARIAELPLEDYPLRPFHPTVSHVAGALALLGLGFATTVGVARLGRGSRLDTANPVPPAARA